MISIKAVGLYSSDFSSDETRLGDAQIITDGTNYEVIDGYCDRGATRLISTLKSMGVKSPYLHISHPHYDHRDGINKILSDTYFTPRALYCQDPDSITAHNSSIRSDINALRNIISKAKAKKIPVVYLGNEQKVEHGDIKFTVYRQYPKYSGNSDAYLNDGSLCYWFPEQRYLTTGDASMWCAYKYNLNPLIVKGGHHGNDMSADGYLKPSQMCVWLYKRGCRFYWDNDFSTRLTDFLMTGREDAINADMTFIDIHGDIDMVFACGKVTITHAGKTYTDSVPYGGEYIESWIKNAVGWWYRYKDGSWPADCMVELPWSKGKSIFCFNKEGYMVTGWQKIDGKWYFFDENGAMVTGWRKINGKWYYLSRWEKGAMVNGWQKLDGKVYYFDASGAMVTDWQKIDERWYYFAAGGAMQIGWIVWEGAWFYLDPTDGHMHTGWLDYKNKRCYLDGSGRALCDCIRVIDGKTYQFDKDCYATEIAVDGKTELNGCDVASYQAGIDFAKMTTTDFAIVKGTQGTWYVNPYADIQYRGAKAAGKLLGMYHYAEGKDPVAEAQYFVKKVGGRVGECILALDWEGHDNSKFNTDAEVAWVLKFAMEVYRLTGVHIFLYMSKGVTRRRNWSEVAKDVRLWCAQYANQEHTDYKSNPWTDNGGFGAWKTDTIRQYSSKGRVTGYGKDLDINRAYMSRAEWLAAVAGKNTVVATAEKPKTQWSAYVSMTTSPVKISNSGSDEHDKYKGGKAGDQTGREWYIRDWYNYPWNCVLRHPLAEVRACLATQAVKAAENDNVGYDQLQRDDYGIELAKADYDPSKITRPVESDCSAGVIANTKSTGHILGILELQNINATYTGNMRASYKAAGFYVLTETKYLKSSDYLLAGDILLNDAHHTCTVITNGAKSGDTVVMPLVKRGSTGAAVEELQEKLNAVNYRNKKILEVDGDFGPLTQAQVIHFQMDRGLDPDGEVGPITWAALIEATK